MRVPPWAAAGLGYSWKRQRKENTPGKVGKVKHGQRRTPTRLELPKSIAPAIMALINETTKKWIYLITYNCISFLLWTWLTFRTVRVLVFGPDTDEYDDAAAGSLYRQLPFPLLAFTQTLAFLEVAHAALGLVGASAATTALQIGGKNLVVRFLFPRFSFSFLFCSVPRCICVSCNIRA